MSKIPKNLLNDDYHQILINKGYTLISQGKVRDIWDMHNGWLLVVATDRISIFDFVLNAQIPKKGEILTAITHLWLTKVLDVTNHLVFREENSENMVNELDLPKELARRSLVVYDLRDKMDEFELIFRHHIGGSVYTSYLETGLAGGQALPPNLPQWSKLAEPIFTPSTKEKVGHDINKDADAYFQAYGKKGRTFVDILKKVYQEAYAYAAERGVLILDTKFEGSSMLEMLADEMLTPDSSRFVMRTAWEKAMAEGKAPEFFDKEPVRNWGRDIPTRFINEKSEHIIGINKLKPENPEHVEFVHSLTLRPALIQDTTWRYEQIFELLAGKKLADYQIEDMGIPA